MATTSFGTSVLIFINLWLITLTSFGGATSAIFLYILGAVDNTIGSCVVLSLICSVLSFTYPVLQSLNVSNTNLHRWHKSWLSSLCVYISRALIVCWVVTTTIGLVVALRQLLCKSGDVKVDALAWQAGLGCWVFRVLVSLNVVLLILTITIFMLLEINGRYVAIGLFHFEFTTPSCHLNTHQHRRRRTLVASAYGDSMESLASPATVNSADAHTLTGSLEKNHSYNTVSNQYTISPSPTYKSLDISSLRTCCATTPYPNPHTQDEESTHELPSSRQSICTNTTFATLPNSRLPSLRSDSIFASSQLQDRPFSMSDIPAIPITLEKQLKKLESIKHGTMSNVQHANRPALYDITNTPKGKFKSSCALPLSTTTTTLPRSTSETTLARIKVEPVKLRTRTHSEVIEMPPPAWCPKSLKGMPLSADPAIKRLTELRRSSAISRSSRRASLSHFEFGFGSTQLKHRGGNAEYCTEKEVADQLGSKQATDTTAALTEKTDNSSVGNGNSEVIEPASTTNKSSSESTSVPDSSTHDLQHSQSTKSKRPKRSGTGMTLSIMPPPIPDRAPGHTHVRRASSTQGPGQIKKQGKTMVERGRYEKLPR